jgi:N4-gp56 family major capsid protein
MALTNFGALQSVQKLAWSKDLWKVARNNSFMMQFTGSGPNSMIQRITELKKSEKGAQAIYQLVADLTTDGVMGDYTLEGNEEAILAYDQIIQIDQIRHANRLAGRMADQKSAITFRETSRDVLAYWLADRLDQLAFLTLSGLAYTSKLNGATRPVLAAGQNLSNLAFAADVTAASTNRYMRWVAGTNTLTTPATASVVAADLPSYKMLVKLKAFAKNQYIRGIKGPGNSEYFHVFMCPAGIAALKQDADYLANLRNAGARGDDNPLFNGAVANVDGLLIHEFRYVYNTLGLASASKWGAGGLIDGQKVLLCGAQALAFADLGPPGWTERDYWDYGNQFGIAVDKIIGFRKPKFMSPVTGTVEDFGVVVVDTAI